MNNSQKNVISGMAVLSLVGLICKIVGALYRIPLAWLIGEQGLATYQLVFPTYNMLLTLSSAGLPVAISRMVSYAIAQNDPRSAKKTFHVAIALLSFLGFLAMLLMLIFSPALAQRSGDIETQPGFTAIAPALLLVCTMSALRGFMQGQQNMVPTAISQLIEQVGKVFVALPLAYFGMKISVAYAAAGVLLGTSIAEAIALLYMFLNHNRQKKHFASLTQDEGKPLTETKSILKQLMALSVPITLSACIVPIAQFIDSGILLNRLMASGFSYEIAKSIYGRFSGYVLTMINIPTALAAAISMSMVPAVTRAVARKDENDLKNHCTLGLRLSFAVSIPCTVGLCLMAKEILSLIYSFDEAWKLDQTAQMLRLSSMTIVLFTGVQSTSGILNGLKKQNIPMITLLIGVLAKIALNYTLVAIPSIHIYGASMASITCYGLSFLPNLFFVHKLTHTPWKPWQVFGKPALAAAAMGVAIWLGKLLLPSGKLWTILLVCIGIVVYGVCAVLFGAVTKDELKPYLNKLRRKKA